MNEASVAAAAESGAALVGEGRQTGEEEEEEEEEQQQLEELADATINLALQGEQAVEEEDDAGGEEGEEEEVCSVCLCELLGSEGGECRLACKHAYHASYLELWQRNCVSKAIEPTYPYCRAPLQFEG